MPKDAERDYLANIGDAGRHHSLYKPFSNAECGVDLASIGIIMALLPPPPARLLDLGCGGGWTSIFFAMRGYQVVGQDIAPDMIDLAVENRERNRLSPDQVTFICGDYESMGPLGEFDCAVFFDSLHHSEDEASAIDSVFKALKPGGFLLTHEPGEGHSINPHSIAAMEQYGVTERDMPPRLIVQRALEAGFSNYRVLPMPHELFDIFYTKRNHPKRWFSKRRYRLIRRVSRLLFSPDMGASSIVVLTK
ncbi:class I SAM-dependent methyltransferase [Sphingobium bisphenolivorans]|uniref:class I SAM-dependent methyltransferase n=1 Tax=Sphingobium bisphenolivorans TaxID=1335760 RepID=UPI0003A870F9|nr:class I SAM-dependent methyltransferase [Sphingobium bisphenolivorans]